MGDAFSVPFILSWFVLLWLEPLPPTHLAPVEPPFPPPPPVEHVFLSKVTF